MKYVENIIIGTGLSSLGCAYTLLSNKKKFIILEASSRKNKILNSKKIYFDKDGTPKKLNKRNHLDILTTKMFGGNSLIWGANSLRLFKSQFAGWPINYNQMKKYYIRAEKILNVKHFDDEISNYLKIKKFSNDNLFLYDDFIKEKIKKIHNGNFIFGLARLALNNKLKVYTSHQWFESLLLKKKIKIKFNTEVISFNRYKNLIKVNLKGKKNNLICKNLFICAGSISTSKIVMNSCEGIDLKAKENSYFIAPCIFTERNNKKINNNDLSQIQVFDKKLGIYSELKYVPCLLKKVLKRKFNILSKFIPNKLINKIYIINGFLPDKLNPYDLILRKNKSSNNFNMHWVKKNISIKNSKKIITKFIKNLSKKLNFIYLPGLIRYYDKGRSYHIGSTIPMVNKSRKFKIFSNKKGQLNFNKKIIICDSANFTNLPSCSVGLTIIANSMRVTEKNINQK